MENRTATILFFLLDGYNEITSEIAKNNLILEIKEMKRLFPAARFLITSRNNLSECFSTGGELPFFCKQVNPLQDTHIELFLKRQFGNQKAEQEWHQLPPQNSLIFSAVRWLLLCTPTPYRMTL